MLFNKFAIVFVGVHGIGKTTVGKLLENNLDNFKYIDQDMCKSNPREYINQIKILMNTHNLILGKCHHNKRTLEPILKLLTDNNFKYKIFNFVPDDIFSLKSILLNRIKHRKDHLTLVMDENFESELKISRILDGFIASYQKPELPFLQIDYTLEPTEISQIIITEIFKETK